MFNIFNNEEKEIKVKTMKKFRQFLEEENENIKNKLMKVYCIMNFEIKNKLDDKEAQFEIKNKLFDIDEMLLYFQDDDQSSGSKKNRNKNTNKINDQQDIYMNDNDEENLHKIKDKYIIKFEIILIYYTLNMYLEDIILERADFFNVEKIKLFEKFKSNLFSIGTFLLNILKLPYHLVKFSIKICNKTEEIENNRDIFEKIYNLEEIMEQNRKETVKTKQIETAMNKFLKNNIKTVEIVLNDTVYKIYFPILSKCREMPTIKKNLKSNTENLENYTYQNLNLYKDITIELKENHA